MQDRIPRRIIQVWGQGEHDLSLLSKASRTNVKLVNPDYEYLFFDNNHIDAFLNEHFPEYCSLFQLFRLPIQRYDFFRYLAIYYYGGFYLDLDVFLASSLDSLLKQECVFPFERLTENMFLRKHYGIDWEIANYAFGSEPRHPFIKAIIDNCVKGQKEPKWIGSMMKSIPWMFRRDFYAFYSSGPGLVTRTLAENPDLAKHVLVLFPENVCDLTKWHLFGEFGVHLMVGTWIKRKGIFRRKWLNLWRLWARKRLLKRSMKLGPKRTLDFPDRILKSSPE
ncbi:MAG TPA: glycosyltransferase [Nitrospirota bacterium]|nr:glycosyltransferase [Nitrospirota bacterium]